MIGRHGIQLVVDVHVDGDVCHRLQWQMVGPSAGMSTKLQYSSALDAIAKAKPGEVIVLCSSSG